MVDGSGWSKVFKINIFIVKYITVDSTCVYTMAAENGGNTTQTSNDETRLGLSSVFVLRLVT